MPSKELTPVPVNDERRVRSYHSAFSGELIIYNLGNNIRLWWAIPVRGVAWAAATEVLLILLTQLSGISMPVLSLDWGFVYIGIPVAVGWLCSHARPEGRPLHVAIWAWIAVLFSGRQTIGGYRRVKHADHMHGSKIKVRATVAPRPKRHLERYAYAAMGVVFVFFLVHHFSGASSPSNVPPHTSRLPVLARVAQQARPALPPMRGVLPLRIRIHPVPHHKVVGHKVATHRRKPVVRHRHVVLKVRHTYTAHVTPKPHSTYTPPPVYKPPVVVHHKPPATVAIRPDPAPSGGISPDPAPSGGGSPCYPGQLGC